MTRSDNRPKLTRQDAGLIRGMYREGYSVTELADVFDVHHSNISRIISRKAYKNG